MLRILLVIVATLGIWGGAIAETYTIQNWPGDLDQVPCEAWIKNPDGSWTQTGIIVSSTDAHGGMTFGPDDLEARIVEKKCRTVKGGKN